MLEKFHSQLDSLFVVSHSSEVTREMLDDVSIAYGHLMRACRLQSSDQFSEALCEEVSVSWGIHQNYIYLHLVQNCLL